MHNSKKPTKVLTCTLNSLSFLVMLGQVGENRFHAQKNPFLLSARNSFSLYLLFLDTGDNVWCMPNMTFCFRVCHIQCEYQSFCGGDSCSGMAARWIAWDWLIRRMTWQFSFLHLGGGVRPYTRIDPIRYIPRELWTSYYLCICNINAMEHSISPLHLSSLASSNTRSSAHPY